MGIYTAKPIQIEAIQYDGTNQSDVAAFGAKIRRVSGIDLIQVWVEKSRAWCDLPPGTWVIRESDGSGFYPCRDFVFEARWEPVGG